MTKSPPLGNGVSILVILWLSEGDRGMGEAYRVLLRNLYITSVGCKLPC